MTPCLRGGDGDRRMAAGCQHHHGVGWFLEQCPPVGEAFRDAVTLADLVDNGPREVADRGNLEAVTQLAEVMEVHDLGDQPAADDADPQLSLSQSCARLYSGHR